MELETAIGVLAGTIANKENELKVLKMALEVLQETFEPQMTALTVAREQVASLTEERDK